MAGSNGTALREWLRGAPKLSEEDRRHLDCDACWAAYYIPQPPDFQCRQGRAHRSFEEALMCSAAHVEGCTCGSREQARKSYTANYPDVAALHLGAV